MDRLPHILRSIEISVGHHTFDALEAGQRDRPLVLMLHGFPQTSSCWRRLMDPISRAGHRCIAPDQRGYSPRARPAEIDAYAIPDLVADAVGFLDALAVERAHIIGHDWGGTVAWHTASRHPDRVLTLTVLSTPHPRALADAMRHSTDQSERSAYMVSWRRSTPSSVTSGPLTMLDASGLPREDIQRYTAHLSAPGAMTAALNWYRAAAYEHTRRMGAITTPTLYMWGSDDPFLGREAAEATGSYVDGPYIFNVVDGAGHWLPELESERLHRAVLAHLDADDKTEV